MNNLLQTFAPNSVYVYFPVINNTSTYVLPHLPLLYLDYKTSEKKNLKFVAYENILNKIILIIPSSHLSILEV